MAGLFQSYAAMPGVPDELTDSLGRIRPVWEPFVGQISRLSLADLTARFIRGDQYLRDAGVYYRQYSKEGTAERDWPLSHIPVILAEAEWQQIASGLIERADLLEQVVADLYGENRLVREGHLPASLIAQNPEWLRPLVGVKPQSGHFLHFLAFEIGRGPAGNWWVLGDRAQAPSGAGFAIENRVATSHIFTDIFAQSNVHRLAGFFRAFRDSLHALRPDHDTSIGILTPGLLNDTYYEHAYIARYLGMMLLEGEDLTVEQGRVMVRTVAGLKPVSVLWRRLDAAWADPLELNETSRLGTPGLLEAVREGHLTLVNALGSGVLEMRALLAFLPHISEVLTGKPLAIPNIATWWCGQPSERDHVRTHAQDMLIGRAMSTRLPFDLDETVAIGGRICDAHGRDLETLLNTAGADLVGQEAVSLSTTPAFVDGALVPRPMSLRLFLARTAQGWQVMPGGYARIGRSGDSSAVAMQKGGSVADVWVVSTHPVIHETLVPQGDKAYQRNPPAVLPSRAADNLFWLGRYVERAEGTIRLLRAYHARLSELDNPSAGLLVMLEQRLALFGIDVKEPIPQALRSTLEAAVNSASHVRDRFSVDGWNALTDLAETARRMVFTASAGDDAARAMGVLLRKISGFSGLVHENMYHSTGWHFLTIGRSLERAAAMTALLAGFAAPDAAEGGLDLAVEVGDSTMSHRSRYAIATTRATVVDLLALDTLNPRAIIFQLSEMRHHISLLPDAGTGGQLTELSRAMLKLHTALAAQTPEGLTQDVLNDLSRDIAAMSDLLTSAYLT